MTEERFNTTIVKKHRDGQGAQRLLFCSSVIGKDGPYCPHCHTKQGEGDYSKWTTTMICCFCNETFDVRFNFDAGYWISSEIKE